MRNVHSQKSWKNKYSAFSNFYYYAYLSQKAQYGQIRSEKK